MNPNRFARGSAGCAGPLRGRGLRCGAPHRRPHGRILGRTLGTVAAGLLCVAGAGALHAAPEVTATVQAAAVQVTERVAEADGACAAAAIGRGERAAAAPQRDGAERRTGRGHGGPEAPRPELPPAPHHPRPVAEPVTGAAVQQPPLRPYVRPPFLREGDSVAVVAISSRTDSMLRDEALRGIEVLRSWGLRVRQGDHLFGSYGWFPAPDSVRAAELQQMLDNPHLRAVLFLRGGYGAVRILDLVDLGVLRRDPKWLAGFSDLTTLHAALRRVGVESIHGAMPAGFRTDSIEADSSARWLREALFGERTVYRTEPHPLDRPGRAVGRLAGGNLSVLHALTATPEAIACDEPVILLLEDVGESIHHIDRMMQTMQRSGLLRRVAGFVVGDFTQIRGEERWGCTAREAVAGYLRDLGVPLLFGLPAGHGRRNAALYMGRPVLLEVTDEGGELRFL